MNYYLSFLLFLLLYWFVINSFIIAQGCSSAYHRIRNVHFLIIPRERTPQKYLDFMFAEGDILLQLPLHAAKILGLLVFIHKGR